jgi:hypothetical protein
MQTKSIIKHKINYKKLKMLKQRTFNFLGVPKGMYYLNIFIGNDVKVEKVIIN